MKKLFLLFLCMLAVLTVCLSSHSSQVVAAEVPTKTEESVTLPDMVIFTAKQQGENWTGYELVDFGVKHGNVAQGNINKFTTYSIDEEAWSATLGSAGDNAYAEAHWKILTQKNDGFIFEFVAKYPVKINIDKSIVGGDWVDNTNLNVYKKSGTEVTLVKNIALASSLSAADYAVEVDLAKGETLYWEFIFEWTPYRNMINLPTATFTYMAQETPEQNDGMVSTDQENVKVEGNKITLVTEQTSAVDSTDGGNYVTIPVFDVDMSSVYVSIKFATTDISGLGLHARGLDANGSEVGGYVAQMISAGWNVKQEEYSKA